ncbi:MAG: choice-of-anchor tandem repeat GloVer-containing protein [Bryobacteraceae bacterium]|jgi:uncharacterized repeat protein (TIGR03803 family)
MQKFLSIAVTIGALFAIRTPGDAATPVLTTLYSFTGVNPADDVGGAFPEAGVVINNNNLFGTTYAGGAGWGSVYELAPPAQTGGAWTMHQLYAFTGGADGSNPRAAVIFSSRGVIFGTTEQGGAFGYGTVFSLTPAGNGTWTQAVIYSFAGAPVGCGTTGNPACDGANPESGLVLTPKGLLYGTTAAGGTGGYGAAFSMTPATGGTWTEKVMYSFIGAPTGCGTTGNQACDGAVPLGGLTLVPATGVVYGTTYSGGTAGYGTVFRLVQSGSVWNETVLYSFNGAFSGVGETPPVPCGTSGQPVCDGGAPDGNVVINSATGALFGTTTLGGNPAGCPQGGYEQGCGAIFQLTPPVAPSTTWTESLLYAFTGAPQDGIIPASNIVMPSSTGPLYGTTFAGGAAGINVCFPQSYTGCGIVYTLRPPVAPSTTWTKADLAVFNGDNGGGPNGVVLSSGGGVLYGTTYDGGLSGGYGTIFQLTF